MPTKSVDIEIKLGSGGPKGTKDPSHVDAMSRARQIQDPAERRLAILEAKQNQERARATAGGANIAELEKAQARERESLQQREEARKQRAQERVMREEAQARQRLQAQQQREEAKKQQEEAKRQKAQERAMREETQARQRLQERTMRQQEQMRRKEAQSFDKATKAVDKLRKGRSVGAGAIDEPNGYADTVIQRRKVEDDRLRQRFSPLNTYPAPTVDRGHAATSEDRIQRGVKEAEEIESRLGQKSSRAGLPGGLGRLASGVGQLPFALAGAMATGRPEFMSGLIGAGGYKLQQLGENQFRRNARKEDAGDSLGILQKIAPPALKIVGAGLMAAGAVTASSINKRLDIARDYAGLELPVYQAMMTSSQNEAYKLLNGQTQTVKTTFAGAARTAPFNDTKPSLYNQQKDAEQRKQMPKYNTWRKAAEIYGMTPQEFTEMMRNFAVGVGVPNSVTGEMLDVLAQSRLQGIDPGALVAVGKLAAPGGGATYGASRKGPGQLSENVSRIIGSAESMGLRGGRIDEYLNRISAYTGQLAENGFMLSVQGANELALALDRKGINEASGTGALRVANRIQSLGPQTARDLGTQMFAPLARGVMLAKGMEGTDSLQGFFEKLSGLSKRKTGGLETISAFRDYLGPEGSLMGLIGSGESVETGKAALSVDRLVGAPHMAKVVPEDLKAPFAVSRAFANRDVSQLEEMTIDGAKTLIEISSKLDQIILAFTGEDSVMLKLMEGVNEALPYLIDIARKL